MQHRDSQQRNPSCFYASTKQVTEDLLKFFVSENFELTCLVFPHIYGEADERPKLLNLLLAAVRNKEPIHLSSGMQVMDLVHVNDIVDSIQVALSPGMSSGRWQVSSMKEVRIVDIVNFVNGVLDDGIEVHYDRLKDRPTDCYALWLGAPALPGWSQKIDVFEWLRCQIAAEA